ncbi:MAG: SIS domain-containing protein [Erysipelotrichaceae bacterium]|nr:SIS domain-containing protein [Erysipelotrichaceae bacterium]
MVTMLDYIKETPQVVNNIIDNSYEYTKDLVNSYINNKYEGLYFIASGSSYNGSLCAKAFIQHVLGLEVKIVTPFTFTNHEFKYMKKEMPICVSQSGCSTNTLDVLKLLKDNNIKSACLVGRDDCDAKEYTDLLVNWHVGEEQIGFVTKGVTSLACFEMIFALELGKALGMINDFKYDKIKTNLKKSQLIQPEMVQNTIELFNKHTEDFTSKNKVIFISSGPGLAVATEAALKITETSCIDTAVCEAEEYLHGPLYSANPNNLFIAIDNNDDESSKRIIAIADALKDISEKVYVISNSQVFDDEHAFRTSDENCLHIAPLYKLSCIQTLAYLMSEATNKYKPHENIIKFKELNKVASKSRPDLYLDLQEQK